jgi:hypothetical protein
MKKVMLVYVVMLILIPQHLAVSQTLSDYISAVNGDTLVIKDYYDMDNQPNSLYYAILLDNVDVPAGRVYELKTNGYYPLAMNPTTPADRAVIIAGANDTRMVVNDNPDRPPIICGSAANSGGINFADDLTVKNVSLMPASSEGWLGWAFFSAANPNLTLTLENVLMEHVKWVFVESSNSTKTSIKISDSYFVNMNGNAGRRSGGVYDNVNYNTDTIWVENSTHVFGQGWQYKFRDHPINKVIFNHNTFINIGHNIFETLGYQSNMAVTQNIFINCQTKPYRPGLDYDETDVDSLPTGIINVRDLPEDYEQLDRKILVDRNLIYWDPRLADIADIVNSIPIDGYTNWVSQMITMNSRTQDMFDDDVSYSYLTEGVWYNQLPNFTDSQNLLSEMVDTLRNYSIAIMPLTAGLSLSDWRLVSTEPEDYIRPDWPIPIDISYDDADLLTAGFGGFPLGDLNWFPAQKTAWLAQRNTEYAHIQNCLDQGDPLGMKEMGYNVPAEFNLEQNYPNPFNPSTTISCTIPKAGYITLKVYNMLGQEVATLLNGFRTAQTYRLTFDGTSLASGVYIARLTAGNFDKSIKLILMK